MEIEDDRQNFKDFTQKRSLLNPRGFIHTTARSIHEWFTGRFNITVTDLLTDAIESLDSKDLVKTNSLLEAAKEIVSKWNKDQIFLGGSAKMEPNKEFQTFQGKVYLPKVLESVRNCVNVSNELINLDQNLVDENKIEKLRTAIQESIDRISNPKKFPFVKTQSIKEKK